MIINKFFHNKRISANAFSMIELAVVILIIGVLIGGILASQKFIAKFRITTAQTLTISSPIHGIYDSVLWLESSLDKSFKDSESSDTNSLSAWYDVRESVNKNNATQSNSGNYPTYSNSINSIQAVKFDGTNGYFTVDGSVLNNTNYTIFVLEQRDSNKSGNYFIGDASSGSDSTTNKNLVLGYGSDGTIKHSQSSDNSYTSSITSYSASSGKPRIFTFVHDKSSGKKTYINGLLAAKSTDTNHLSGMTNLTIGKSYQGQIGEIVIFARALTTEEIQSVEDYLGKKWSSKILRSVGSSAASGGIGGSCVGGVVGTDACLTACAVIAANGITDTTVQGGSGSLTCNTAANFKDSLSYSCINGVFSYTGDKKNCDCADGYSASGSSCNPINPSCSGGTEDIASVSGYKLHVFKSSGTLTCTNGGTIQLLVVGGGGGGGWGGGGGGAGGLVYNSSYLITAQSYSITVGQGGTGSDGVSSSFNSVVNALGGGAQCSAGGSGGGGGYGSGCSGAGTAGQGNAGGFCTSCGSSGAGGGGAGSQGSNPAGTSSGGNGGAGLYYGSVFSTNYGHSGWFASGGGGSGYIGGTIGTASSGGGGNGSLTGGSATRESGIANTGGGGGGGNGVSTTGGSGIVIIRYAR